MKGKNIGKIKKSFLIGFIITFFIFNLTNQAFAATNPMSIMTINGSLLPEYDNEYLLELYTITMTNTSDKPFSGELTWRIPKDNFSVFVARNEDIDKNKSIGNIRKFSDYDELYWKPSKPIPPKGIVNWHIEYYDTTAIQGNTDKNFTYTFKQPYNIDIASLVILQPKKATNFQLIPAPENTKQSEQGELYGYSIRNAKPNEEKVIKVNYTKSDPNPSFGSNSKTVAIGDNTGKLQSESETTTKQSTQNNTLMYALVALVIIIAGAAILLISKKQIQEEQINKKYKLKGNNKKIIEEDYMNIEGKTNNIQDKEFYTSDNELKDRLQQDFLKGRITENEYYEKLSELE